MSLKQLMKQQGVTQQCAADYLGVHQTRISQICCGVGELSLQQATLLAKLLGCSVDEIARAAKCETGESANEHL